MEKMLSAGGVFRIEQADNFLTILQRHYTPVTAKCLSARLLDNIAV